MKRLDYQQAITVISLTSMAAPEILLPRTIKHYKALGAKSVLMEPSTRCGGSNHMSDIPTYKPGENQGVEMLSK